MSDSTDNKSRQLSNGGVRLYAILILLLTLSTYFLIERASAIDELGLYNPIYTYLHSGKMTYPAYAQYYSMTIHPPIHYLLIAWFMKLGMSFYYAELVPVFIITCVILLLIEEGQFSTPVKFGLLTGFFSGSILISSVIDLSSNASSIYSLVYSRNYLYSVRPDLNLALSWFAGLLALESARLDNWNSKKLFLGSFLLTYASGLHYYGIPAFTGIFIYVIWMGRALGLRQARTKFLAIASGALLFGIPYLTLFVIPYWQDIHSIVKAVQQTNDLWQPLQRHFEMYELWKQNVINNFSLNLLYLFPIFWLKIPAILLASLVLAIYPCTRGIAFASLPMPLFVLLYSQGKSASYYVPELILYSCAIAIVTIDLSTKFFKKILPSQHFYLFIPSVITTLSIILIHSWLSTFNGLITLKPHVHEMDLARAASKEIIGSDALVGSRIALWYSSGAAHWYDVSPDLLWKKDISKVNLKQYFSQFDAIAENGFMSNVTENTQRTGLSSWYLDGTLNLKGFYFAQSHSNLSYLLLNSQPDNIVQGYGQRNNQLYHFRQQAKGNYIFAALVCPFNVMRDNTLLQADFFNSLYPPDQAGNSFPTKLALRTFVMPKEQYQKQQSLFLQCRLRDEIVGTLDVANQQHLITSLQQDSPIHFYRTFDEIEVSKILQDTAGSHHPIPVVWDHWKPANSDVQTNLDKTQNLLQVKTNISTYDFQLVSEPIPIKKDSTYVVQFDMKPEMGGFGLHIVDQSVKNIVASKYWCDARPEDTFQTKRFIINSANYDKISLVISNCMKDKPGQSKFSLRNLSLLQVQDS
jgi:hypothetical protein